METRELTGGEAIVQGLLAHGIDTVFALPGAQIYGLIDRPALERAFAADRPVLIEVKVPRGSDSDPWKFIHPTFS
jgi:thiamine pyrophosphate-dependent acetolactate synthase large subunit-like protein